MLRNYLAQLTLKDAAQGDVALTNELFRHPNEKQKDKEHFDTNGLVGCDNVRSVLCYRVVHNKIILQGLL